MNPKQAQEFMKSKGFPFVYEWEDAPWTVYQEHFHQGKTALYTLSGSVEFYFPENSQTKMIQPWDYFEVKAQKLHSAKVGKDAWRGIVGEMIEGDS